MKILKFLIGLIVLLFLIVLIGGLLSPKVLHVERSVTIDKPANVVFSQVNNLRNWENWSPWHGLDPETVWEYGGRGQGQGAWYTWASEQSNVGKGKFTILESVPNQKIKAQMEFEGMGNANTGFYFTDQGGKTKVVWDFDSDPESNPIKRFMGQTFGKMGLGKSYQEGLDNLKRVAEGT